MKLSLKYIAVILFFCFLSFNDSILRRISKGKIKIEKIEQYLVDSGQSVLNQVVIDLN
jgi:hypothetical protein|tara:strand:+ start:4165 stop:4338 length:174 start_codon:yes stop_codon:yes gene_type:complete